MAKFLISDASERVQADCPYVTSPTAPSHLHKECSIPQSINGLTGARSERRQNQKVSSLIYEIHGFFS